MNSGGEFDTLSVVHSLAGSNGRARSRDGFDPALKFPDNPRWGNIPWGTLGCVTIEAHQT